MSTLRQLTTSRLTTADGRARARGSAGFTLIELLGVIGIIVLLIGLLLPALSAMRTSAQKDKVSTAMQKLETAHSDYRDRVGERLNLQNDYPYEWTSGSSGPFTSQELTDMNSIERFVFAISNSTESGKNLIDSVPQSMLVDRDDDGFEEVRDPWGDQGQPLVYRPYAPGVDAANNNPKYPSGSQHYRNVPFTDTDGSYELKIEYDPFFASKGPNGLWDENNSTAEDDDLYSSETER